MKIITIATENEGILIPDNINYDKIVVTGVGGLNVIGAMKDIPLDSMVINYGYAGSVNLPIGETFKVGRSELLHDIDFDTPSYHLGDGPICYTACDFVQNCARTGCLFDMELAFICAMGFRKVLSMKTVSDHCNYSEYLSNSDVASFKVNHITLRPGINERSRKKGTISWDIRLVAPSDGRPLTPGAIHVLEHCLAKWLREMSDEIIAVCPMGCLTGMYVITTENMNSSEMRNIITQSLMRLPVTEVPGMNSLQCGNPELKDIEGAERGAKEFLKAINYGA